MKRVTIVVPVYGDWTTLELCIESLKQYVTDENKILLVNDMGPEWESLECNILRAIDGFPLFQYERNSENIGFVKTCNRAVLELDQSDNDILLLNSDTKVTEGFLQEMQRVLYLSEKHGIVCPRSNSATLLTVPIHQNTQDKLSPEESYRVYKKVKDLLPEFQIIPTGVGFAMLIKREIIKEVSLFDEVYGKGYNEENDFCMRANQYGYSIVMANRAYIYHYEGKSFGETKNVLEEKNHRILLERYPYYNVIVDHYFSDEMDPVDYFADQIACEEKKRFLISLYEFPPAYNGSTEYGCMFLKEFHDMYRDKYDIHVLISREADAFFHISEQYTDISIWHPDNIVSQTFYLGMSVTQVFHMEHLILLSQTCLKFMFNMQDVISLRCRQFFGEYLDREEIFRKGIQFCDAIYYISDFTKRDTELYYEEEFKSRDITTTVILDGTDTSVRETYSEEYKLPFEQYFFVFGNKFKHKGLDITLKELRNTKYNLIYLGADEEGYSSENIYGYPSGNLPEEFIDYLLDHSTGILFPSFYEGFGLPVLKAIKFDKKIIVRDTEVNRELVSHFDTYADNMLFFRDFSEVQNCLERIMEDPKVVYKNGIKKNRSWRDTTIEIEKLVTKVMCQELDVKRLRDRCEFFNYMVAIGNMYDRRYQAQIASLYGEMSLKKSFKRAVERRIPKTYGRLRKIKNNIFRR